MGVHVLFDGFQVYYENRQWVSRSITMGVQVHYENRQWVSMFCDENRLWVSTFTFCGPRFVVEGFPAEWEWNLCPVRLLDFA